MMTVRVGNERHHSRRQLHQMWQSFHAKNRADPLADGFGVLEVLNEDQLPPGAVIPRHPHHDFEILTYVREGALAFEDSLGQSGVVHAGEFQLITAGSGVRHSEMNPSLLSWTHVFQLWLRPCEAGLDPMREQRRFSAADRRHGLCVVASTDGREGSLRIRQDAVLYSALMHDGQHVAHPLGSGRSAWVHVVHGAVMIGGVLLGTSDGAGIVDEHVVSITARGDAEILLADLCNQMPMAPRSVRPSLSPPSGSDGLNF